MRLNQPVTQRAYELSEDMTLLSTTDTQSHLSYANAAFVTVSGYSREELMGQPHNIVRHPDMPPEAFADMWATLKAGQSWTALVKNRRKNGDHYWVRANATPIQSASGVTGYMSVRTKPSNDEVAEAETLYRAFREGKANGLKFHKGLIVRSGLRAWTSVLKHISVGWRVGLGLAGIGAQVLLAAWLLLGLSGGTLAALAGVLAFALATGAWWLNEQICSPLRSVQSRALRVAAGQVSSQEKTLGRVDEIGMIERAITQAGLNLRSLLDDVSEQARALEASANEISQGNLDLSNRTEKQAASLEETASSMEEINSTARHNADNAVEADALARQAAEVAASGGGTVGNVVESMRQIDEASRQIVDIIGVIDSIAFQTNILALNAAVEAARAGEQGRGFAVVASEVRALAGRSADAAKQVKTLINTSVARVEQGAKQADRAGETMQEIVAAIERVSNIMGEIANASRQQMSGVGLVSEAVVNLDQSTQQNAALVEQSSAAATSLRHQATHLVEAVGAFRKNGEHASRKAPIAPASSKATSAPMKATAKSPAAKVAAQVIAKAAAPRPAKPAAPAAPVAPTRTAAPSDASDEWTSF
jgi:aerotaxis receptor